MSRRYTYKNYVHLLKPGDKIEKHWLFRNNGPIYGVKVRVCSIVNPSNFWVQVKTQKIFNEVKQLSRKINKFYSSTGYRHRIDPDHCITGFVCATRHQGRWYRASVLHTYLLGTERPRAIVLFLDFGTVIKVDMHDLCYLAKAFSYLPQQAIQARLAYISPNGQYPNEWPQKATDSFRELTKSRLFDCIVMKNDVTCQISLVMTDASVPVRNLTVNDALLAADLAVPDPDPF